MVTNVEQITIVVIKFLTATQAKNFVREFKKTKALMYDKCSFIQLYREVVLEYPNEEIANDVGEEIERRIKRYRRWKYLSVDYPAKRKRNGSETI